MTEEKDILCHLYARYVASIPKEKKSDSFTILAELTNAYYYCTDDLARNKDLKCLNSFDSFCMAIWSCTPLKRLIPNINDAIKNFKDKKHRLTVCGCAILSEDLQSILLVQDKSTKAWSLPRGKKNEGETNLDTAVREVREETGLKIRYYIDENNVIKKRIVDKQHVVYIVPYHPFVKEFNIREKEEISMCKFWPLTNLPTKMFDVKDFLSDILKYIKAEKKSKKMIEKEFTFSYKPIKFDRSKLLKAINK